MFSTKNKKILKLSLLLLLIGCATPVKIRPIYTKYSYEKSFRLVRSYIKKCLPGAFIRSNLYTDIAQAEIIIDQLPTAYMAIVGATPISTVSGARVVVEIQITGNNKGSLLSSKNEFSRTLANNALFGGKCVKK